MIQSSAGNLCLVGVRQKIYPANYRRGFISVKQVFIAAAADDGRVCITGAPSTYPLLAVQRSNVHLRRVGDSMRGVIYKRNDTTMRNDKLDSLILGAKSACEGKKGGKKREDEKKKDPGGS